MDYRARYYSARLGRFASADTVVPDPADPQAWNRYAYVLNNPTKYNDPSGHALDCSYAGGGCEGEPRKHPVIQPYRLSTGTPGRAVAPLRQKAALVGNRIGLGFDTTELWMSVSAVALEMGGIAVGGAAGSHVAPGVGTAGGGFVGWLATSALGDKAESMVGKVDLVANLATDFLGGKTYIDGNTNEFVLGQDSTVTLVEEVGDFACGFNECDIFLNVLAMSYDTASNTGLTRSLFELRIPMDEAPYLAIYPRSAPELESPFNRPPWDIEWLNPPLLPVSPSK